MTTGKKNRIEFVIGHFVVATTPEPKPVNVKRRRWGELKSGLYGLITSTPETQKTVSSKFSHLSPKGGGEGESWKLTKKNILGLRAWLLSKPDSDLVISARNEELKGKVQQN